MARRRTTTGKRQSVATTIERSGVRGRPRSIATAIVVEKGQKSRSRREKRLRAIVDRYRVLFAPPELSLQWYEQHEYEREAKKNRWWPGDRTLPTTDEWGRHLDWRRRYWLGWACPSDRRGNQVTSYVVFDIDAKKPDEEAKAIEVTRQVVGFFGEPWFVARSPSYGFHVGGLTACGQRDAAAQGAFWNAVLSSAGLPQCSI